MTIGTYPQLSVRFVAPNLDAGWPSHPDTHGRPGFPSSNDCCQGHHTLLPHAAAVQLHRCVARGEGMGREGRLCAASCSLGNPRFALFVPNWCQAPPGQKRFNPAGVTLAGISRGPNGASKLLLHQRGPMGRLGWTGEPECHGQGILGEENKGFSSERQGDRISHPREGQGGKGKICPLVSPSLGRLLLLLSLSNTLRVVEGIFEAISKAF